LDRDKRKAESEARAEGAAAEAAEECEEMKSGIKGMIMNQRAKASKKI